MGACRLTGLPDMQPRYGVAEQPAPGAEHSHQDRMATGSAAEGA